MGQGAGGGGGGEVVGGGGAVGMEAAKNHDRLTYQLFID